jgi:hypothetical protein
MALPTPPFPPSGHFVEYVRGSSRALIQAESVAVSTHAARRFPISLPFVLLGNSESFCARVSRVAFLVTDLDN